MMLGKTRHSHSVNGQKNRRWTGKHNAYEPIGGTVITYRNASCNSTVTSGMFVTAHGQARYESVQKEANQSAAASGHLLGEDKDVKQFIKHTSGTVTCRYQLGTIQKHAEIVSL